MTLREDFVKLRIRRADIRDASALTSVAHRAKRHWRYPDEWILAWRDDLTVTERTFSEQVLYVAEVDDRIVGFYGLSNTGDERVLEHMWVEPELMGRDVGRELFRHAVDTARAGGARRIRIASDPNAAGFYRAMGALPAGTVPSLPSGRALPVLVLEL